MTGEAELIYRRDIDGLRAVAIVPVVFYHAAIPFFSGGFVGVDVFFVISGFLITGLIVDDLAGERFSLAHFYERRIRRIFPALMAVMAFCVAAGWLFMVPDDYRRLGLSIIATALFSSNIFFWRQSGYFDGPSNEVPLLHTWSLAVEEQFYILFPLYLIVLTRWMPKYRTAITLVVCLISFFVAAVAVFLKPSAVFYLAPTRAWELLIGSLIALGVLRPARNAIARNGLSLLGLTLIFLACFSYSRYTVFPGMSALLPTVGAGLIILNTSTGVSAILSSAPFVFVGRISYSLYLWHFVLLAFASYLKVDGLTAGESAFVLALGAAVSLLSWHFIEQPVRLSRNRMLRAPWLFAFSAVPVGLFCIFGGVIALSGGEIGRAGRGGFVATSSLAVNCLGDEFNGVNLPLCGVGNGSGPLRFALWGDSHAQSLRAAIDESLVGRDISGVLIGAYNCAALLGVSHSLNTHCKAYNDEILAYLAAAPSVQTVILAGFWAGYAESTAFGAPYDSLHIDAQRQQSATAPPSSTVDQNHEAFAAGLENTVAALKAAGKSVWIVGPVPEQKFSIPKALYIQSFNIFRNTPLAITFEDFEARDAYAISLLVKIAKKYDVGLIWPHKVLCTSSRCGVERNGTPLYIDRSHLSEFGAKSIATIFRPIFP